MKFTIHIDSRINYFPKIFYKYIFKCGTVNPSDSNLCFLINIDITQRKIRNNSLRFLRMKNILHNIIINK